MQHANQAVDEGRRAEFVLKGGRIRGTVKGKRWLLLTRWVNLESRKRQELNELFALNRRVRKPYLLKESLDRTAMTVRWCAICSVGWINSDGSGSDPFRRWRRCCSITWTAF
jgi:hypothetical protein